MGNIVQCEDNKADRKIGEFWERAFCTMAARLGKSFTPMQIGHDGAANWYILDGKRYSSRLLPDVTIWTFPGEHHEIKHKEPTRTGKFGLEVYRFDSLLKFSAVTRQSVMYTIHNHKAAGGRDVTQNNPAHWMTVEVGVLQRNLSSPLPGDSWVNGQKREVQIYYWPIVLWQPLMGFWKVG